MDPEGLAFRDTIERRKSDSRRLVAMSVLLLLVCVLLATKSCWSGSRVADGALVQVRGEVPRPGWYRLEHADVHHALSAAGMSVAGFENAPIADGWTLNVEVNGRIKIMPTADLLVFSLPLVLNLADVESLAALPGIGRKKAQAIVGYRLENGDFSTLDELLNVPGIGPHTLGQISPYLSVKPPVLP